MSDIDNKITQLKARIAAAQLAQARAEATTETAKATQDSAMARLKDEFGVDSLADARGKLVELEDELQQLATSITRILDEHDL